MLQTATRLKLEAQAAAVRFAEVNANNDFKLDFDEFYCMQPTPVRDAHSHAEIRGYDFDRWLERQWPGLRASAQSPSS